MARTPFVMLALVAFLMAAGLLANARPARAQENADLQIETLFEFTLEPNEVPPQYSAINLLRLRFEPGAMSPLHLHPGPEFNFIEGGTFRVLVQGKALLNPRESPGTPEAGSAQPPDGEFVMRSTESIAYMPGTAMTFRNSGSSEAVMLAAVIQPFGPGAPPTYVAVGVPPDESPLPGLSSESLGVGLATALPEGRLVVRLERITLGPEQPIPAFADGPVLLSLVEGPFEFRLDDGAVQVSRFRDQGARPDAEVGTAFTLETGDAMFFANGMAEASRAGDEGTVQFLRYSVEPVDAEAAATPIEASPEAVSDLDQPGVISVTPVPRPSPTPEPTVTPTPEATSEPEPAVIEEGATVVVNDVSVRLRAGPSTETEIVGAVDTGHVLVVTGPSQEGDGFVWWPVEDPNDPAVAGFIAADFIDIQEDEGE